MDEKVAVVECVWGRGGGISGEEGAFDSERTETGGDVSNTHPYGVLSVEPRGSRCHTDELGCRLHEHE